jgi:uncharacterized protein YggE
MTRVKVGAMRTEWVLAKERQEAFEAAIARAVFGASPAALGASRVLTLVEQGQRAYPNSQIAMDGRLCVALDDRNPLDPHERMILGLE